MDVEGVTITHPERVVFPGHGITKADLATYYVAIAPLMLPHVIGRPLSLVRCPQGQGGQCFYQKHWSHTVPAGLGTVDIDDGDEEPGDYVFVRDVQGLVALVQYGVLELHLWGARADNVEAPDRIVFDLDPADNVPWKSVAATAKRVRDLLKECGLESWLKTSGGKGLHVVVPIARRAAWEDVKDFSHVITTRLVEENPELLLAVASKASREGKIFVDYLRNSRGATAVAPWSTRARDGAPVSEPVAWTKLASLKSGNALTMTDAMRQAKQRRTDPWAAMLSSKQQLTATVMRKAMNG